LKGTVRMNAKKPSESRSYKSEIVLASHINGVGRLFGGILMQWIDILGGVVARRHSGKNVTTACIDQLDFIAAARQNDIIFMVGQVTYTGKTSMEVRVDCYVEDGSSHSPMATAYLVYVALTEDEKPSPIPALDPETEEEVREFEAGKLRRAARNA